MTVNYNLEVSTSGFGTFLRLMFRWRGSIYKSLYKEILIFLALYYLISFSYRFAMSTAQRNVFEQFSVYCDTYATAIPVSFILGFYMTIVFTRWNQIFSAVAWPDNMGLYIGTYMKGNDPTGRLYRRTVMRYLALSQVLVLRNLSTNVRKRFPTLRHLLQAGLYTEKEFAEYEKCHSPHSKYWIPLQWAANLMMKARLENRITSDMFLENSMKRLVEYRQTLHNLECLDWISIPLIYSQVVTLATWFYFLMCVIGRQFLDSSKNLPGHNFDAYFPLFTVVQLLVFAGWLKAAETLLNPMGEDDDDFELNYIIDRNLHVGFQLVDENFDKHPAKEKDVFWDDEIAQMPYTKASLSSKTAGMIHSCADFEISEEDAKQIPTEAELRREHLQKRLRAVPKMLAAVRAIQNQQRTLDNKQGNGEICDPQLLENPMEGILMEEEKETGSEIVLTSPNVRKEVGGLRENPLGTTTMDDPGSDIEANNDDDDDE